VDDLEEVVVVDDLEEVVVVVEVVVVTFEVVVELLEVVVEVLLLELELPPTLPPGPLRFEIPFACRLVGNSGSISFNQTVSYIPWLPSEARLSGSRLPHCAEFAQHALLLPHNGPAAQADQPMYSGLSAM